MEVSPRLRLGFPRLERLKDSEDDIFCKRCSKRRLLLSLGGIGSVIGSALTLIGERVSGDSTRCSMINVKCQAMDRRDGRKVTRVGGCVALSGQLASRGRLTRACDPSNVGFGPLCVRGGQPRLTTVVPSKDTIEKESEGLSWALHQVGWRVGALASTVSTSVDLWWVGIGSYYSVL